MRNTDSSGYSAQLFRVAERRRRKEGTIWQPRGARQRVDCRLINICNQSHQCAEHVGTLMVDWIVFGKGAGIYKSGFVLWYTNGLGCCRLVYWDLSTCPLGFLIEHVSRRKDAEGRGREDEKEFSVVVIAGRDQIIRVRSRREMFGIDG